MPISVPEMLRRDQPFYTMPLELLFQGIHSAGRPTIYLNGYDCEMTHASLVKEMRLRDCNWPTVPSFPGSWYLTSHDDKALKHTAQHAAQDS